MPRSCVKLTRNLRSKTTSSEHASKARISEEAARLLNEQGVLDYAWARHKAAQRLGVKAERDLPDLQMIENAFVEYQALFRPQDSACLERQLQIARDLMQRFSAFSPQLIGPLTRGLCAPRAQIECFLFADSPKELIFTLMQEKLPWEAEDQQLDSNTRATVYYLHFQAHPCALQLLPLSARKHPPLDLVTGRRSEGLTLAQLDARLALR